jgi:integrase
MGFVESNPIQSMEKPTAAIRQEFIPPELWQTVLDSATDQLFRDWLFVMLSTGMRVTEMLRLEAKHFDGSKFVLPIADSKGRKRSRVIHLPAEALAIVQRLADERPEGKLFRNRRGKPFTRNSIRCRFRHLKKKLGMPRLRATDLRHSFAHYRLTQGQDSLTVAKLMGHVDTTMLARRYGHIEANNGFMDAAANQVAFPSLPSIPSNQNA